jgi:lipopolysaccharide heptosyltransferase II
VFLMPEVAPLQRTARNILIIQLGDIGDVVLSIPAFRAVRENFPRAEITVAVREKANELIRQIPWVDGVIVVNQDRRSPLAEIFHQREFFSSVREHRFDLAFDLRTGTRGAVLAFLSGAKERVGFLDPDGPWRNRLFTRLYRLEYRLPQHVSAYYSSLLEAHGLTIGSTAPEMRVLPEMKERAAKILQCEGVPAELPVIAIQPFSLWRYKEWNIEKYIRLVQGILTNCHVSIAITGSPDEKQRAREMVDRCNQDSPSVFNLAGKTSIGELAALLASCRLFIGSDSAGVHIAAAVGTPTVTIFGPSSPASWAPVGESHAIVQKVMPCIPCREKGCDGSEVSRCLKELDVDEVWTVVRMQLQRLGLSAA